MVFGFGRETKHELWLATTRTKKREAMLKIDAKLGPVGSCFHYKGIRMEFTHSATDLVSVNDHPIIGAEYVDKAGVIRNIEINSERLCDCKPVAIESP